MAKTNKPSNAQTGNSGKGAAKQPASEPVIMSNPVEPGAATVSRIPPSQPIESTMLGKSEHKIEPAAAKPKALSDSDKASAKATASAKPAPAKAPDAQATAAKTAQPAPVVVKKSGFWPMLFGGAIAAGLGAGATIYTLPHLPASMRGLDPAALQSQAEAAGQAQLKALREETVAAATQAGSQAGTAAAQELLAKTGQTDAAPATAADSAALNDLNARIEALGAQVKAMADVPAMAVPAGNGDGSVPADMAGQLAALQQQVVAQSRTLAALNERPQIDPQAVQQLQALAANADQVQARIAEVAQQAEASLANVQSQADAATKRAQTVASVAAIGTALERGGAADAAVQQLQQAGVAVPEQLSQAELPTLVEIQTAFDGASRAALRASLKEQSQGGSAMNAIGNFLRVQTGARSVEPRDGGDPDAVLSRATVQVQQGDLSAALTELDALPPAGKEVLASWTAQASAYLAAQAALNDVAQTLN
ncbi:MAG: COG4223 family protein [Paracoccus sp. (in: a-proteobacteria)]